MFTGTPPATRRNARGTPGRRAQEQQEYLPPIRSRLSVSYGSPFISMPPRRRTADLQRPLSEQLQQTVVQLESRRLQEGLPPLPSLGTRTGGTSDSDEELSEPEDFGNDSSMFDSPTKEMSAEEERMTPEREPSHQLESEAEKEMSESPSKHSQILSDSEEQEQSMEPEEPVKKPEARKARAKKDTSTTTPSRRNPPRKGRATPSRTIEQSTTPSFGDEDEGEQTETREEPQARNGEWRDEESWFNYPVGSSTIDSVKTTDTPLQARKMPLEPASPQSPFTHRYGFDKISAITAIKPRDISKKVADNVRFYGYMFSDVLKWVAIVLGSILLLWFMGVGPIRTAADVMVVRPASAFMEWKHSFSKSTVLPPESAEELINRLMKLEKKLGWVDTKFESHDGQLTSISNSIHNLETNAASYAQQMRTRVADLEKSIEDQQKLIKSGKLTEGERKHLAKLETELSATNQRVKEFEQRLAAVEDGYAEIRKQLPDHIALRQDHRGKVTLRPEFIMALMDELQRRDITPGNKAKVTPGVPVSQSWAEWLRQNEHNLKGLVSDETDAKLDKAARDGLVVNKDTVVRMLRDLSDRTMPELEKKIATSIAAAQSKIKKPTPASNAGAVLQHNYDVLASSPDYAAWATGSRIDPYVTSPTYLGMGWAARMYHQFIGLDHPPTTPGNVLASGGELGNCWAFTGSKGNLGIILPLSIFPTDLTIEHVSYQLALDKTSAPKDIEFWVEVRNATLRSRLATVANGILKDKVTAIDQSIPRGYVKVASFQYNFSEQGTARQVFSVPMQLREVLGDGNGVEKVLFRINGNYGNDLYTCLYRFRVHGIQDGADEGMGPRGGPGVGAGAGQANGLFGSKR